MQLADLNWPSVQALAPETPVVFPVAALEQHSHHLPLFTDSMILGEIVRRTALARADNVLFAPLLWLGNSDHHLDFPGTLSAPPRAYLDMLTGLLDNFLRHGFRRLILLNGHGGNMVPAQQATFELRQMRRDQANLLLLTTTYWEWAEPAELKNINLTQTSMGHACEWETSMILHLAPQLVGQYQKATPVPSSNRFHPAHRAWMTRERSEPGHIGDPAQASPEKGAALLDCFTRGVDRFLQRVLDWDGSSWA